MESLKIPNSQSNLEREEQSGKHHASWFQTILQSYSNQNNMVLAKKHTHRSVEQQPRNKPMHMWSINSQQRGQEYTTGKGQSLPQMVLGKLDSHVLNMNETGPLNYAIHKNQLKCVKKLEHKTWHQETPVRKHRW